MSRPTSEERAVAPGNVDRGKADLVALHRNDHGVERVRIHRGQTDLLTPAIDVIGVAAAIAGKGYNRNIGLFTVFFGRETRVAHGRGCRRRPALRNIPFDLRRCRNSPAALPSGALAVAFASRDELTHFKKFSFSAPTSAGFPRILKNAVRPSSDAMAPMMRPSLLESPFSGCPVRSTTAILPRAVGNFLNGAGECVGRDRRLRELR